MMVVWEDNSTVPCSESQIAAEVFATTETDGTSVLSLRSSQPGTVEPVVACQPDGRTWRTGPYIGVIGAGEQTVSIRPRIGTNVVFEWLRGDTRRLRLHEVDETATHPDTRFVAELMAHLWVAKFRRAARHSLPSRRVHSIEAGSMLKGCLSIRHTIKHQRNKPHEAAFIQIENSLDTYFARAIVAAFNSLGTLVPSLPRIVPPDLLSHLHRLKREVRSRNPPSRSDIERARVTPATIGFRSFALFCLEVLNRIGELPHDNGSAGSSYTLLLDVSELWEHHVETCVSAALPLHSVVNGNLTQERWHLLHDIQGPALKRHRLIPDLLVKDSEGRVVCVIDAKYKPWLSDSTMNREDVYQMVSYLDFFGADRPVLGLFLYPVENPDANNEPLQMADSFRLWTTPSSKAVSAVGVPVGADDAVKSLSTVLPHVLAATQKSSSVHAQGRWDIRPISDV